MIGPYRIGEMVGAGGMGEVYRARDTRLNRDVALKVLPEIFASNSDRLARSHREAQVLASLNHANIAAIYGLEETGNIRALVMELVEGPTLADRIARGPIPLDEALPIAGQIAEALEYAHERGIIHRDLKPSNIKLAADGIVKVLDFGLAKALGDEQPGTDRSNSPTLSLAATQAGLILGTAAYMSPEQAKGIEVDRRADIWAFGVVLYEMLAGKPLFDEPSVSETLAAVLKGDLKLQALPADLPAPLKRLVERCLNRDRKRRLRDIGEARIVIEETIANPRVALPIDTHSAPQVPPTNLWRRTLPWALVTVLSITLAGIATISWRSSSSPQSPMRLSVALGADASLYANFGAGAIISPDGQTVAFVGRAGDKQQVYLRKLDQFEASPLGGTEGARHPFFSHDGKAIAFFADGKLKKIAVTGGAAITLADALNDRGGHWHEDDSIVFAPNVTVGLSRVSSTPGNQAEALTKLDGDEGTHRWPQMLPGGKAVLFTVNTARSAFEDASIAVQSLPAGDRKIVYRGGYHARYLPSGHIVFVRGGTLFAAPFDLNRLEMTAQPQPVIVGLYSNSGNGGAQFAFSNDGKFVYVQGAAELVSSVVQWLDHEGKFKPLRSTRALVFNPQFSPRDGRYLAMDIGPPQERDIWIYEWARDTMNKLTSDPKTEEWPVWSPDGRRITFFSDRNAQGTGGDLYWQRTNGTGDPQRLTENGNLKRPGAWHPSGKYLAYFEQQDANNLLDIMILPMEGDESSGWKPGKPYPFLATPVSELAPAFSPDGRWLAYHSNKLGAPDVWVRPFPARGGSEWQISTTGGVYPTWSPNGRELFFRTNDQQIMVVSYTTTDDTFRITQPPRVWAEGRIADRGAVRTFDIHPDGKRFAVLRNDEAEADLKLDKLSLILNFFDELRRVAPVP